MVEVYTKTVEATTEDGTEAHFEANSEAHLKNLIAHLKRSNVYVKVEVLENDFDYPCEVEFSVKWGINSKYKTYVKKLTSQKHCINSQLFYESRGGKVVGCDVRHL